MTDSERHRERFRHTSPSKRAQKIRRYHSLRFAIRAGEEVYRPEIRQYPYMEKTIFLRKQPKRIRRIRTRPGRSTKIMLKKIFHSHHHMNTPENIPKVTLMVNQGRGTQVVATKVIPGKLIHLDRLHPSRIDCSKAQKSELINPRYELCSTMGVEWQLNGKKAMVSDKWAERFYVLVSDMPEPKETDATTSWAKAMVDKCCGR